MRRDSRQAFESRGCSRYDEAALFEPFAGFRAHGFDDLGGRR
jgi:hypothetical protein